MRLNVVRTMRSWRRAAATVAITAALLPASAIAQQDDAAARQLFALANQERTQRHLPPLEWSDALAEAARQHTEHMVERHELSHDLSGEPGVGARIGAAGARVSAYAENIGYAGDAASVHSGWMHSAPHRANLLNGAYDAIGIAAFRVGDALWATEDFATRTRAISADDADVAVRERIQAERQRAHLPPLKLHVVSGSAAQGCSSPMATAPPGPGTRSRVTYTTSTPQSLPDVLTTRVDDPKFQSYSISVCEEHSAQGFTTMKVNVLLAQ